jgi:Ca2+-binding EF-hand superfamily protein
MKSLITTLAALAVATSFTLGAEEAKKPAAGAEKPKHDPAEVFKKLDTNADGSVSLEEFKAGPAGKKDAAKAEEIFKKKDKDSDGKLSLEEFSAAGGKKNK